MKDSYNFYNLYYTNFDKTDKNIYSDNSGMIDIYLIDKYTNFDNLGMFGICLTDKSDIYLIHSNCY